MIKTAVTTGVTSGIETGVNNVVPTIESTISSAVTTGVESGINNSVPNVESAISSAVKTGVTSGIEAGISNLVSNIESTVSSTVGATQNAQSSTPQSSQSLNYDEQSELIKNAMHSGVISGIKSGVAESVETLETTISTATSSGITTGIDSGVSNSASNIETTTSSSIKTGVESGIETGMTNSVEIVESTLTSSVATGIQKGIEEGISITPQIVVTNASPAIESEVENAVSTGVEQGVQQGVANSGNAMDGLSEQVSSSMTPSEESETITGLLHDANGEAITLTSTFTDVSNAVELINKELNRVFESELQAGAQITTSGTKFTETLLAMHELGEDNTVFDSYVVNIKRANGEVDKLVYKLEQVKAEAEGEEDSYVVKLLGASPSDKGIQQQVQRIEKAYLKAVEKLSGFNSRTHGTFSEDPIYMNLSAMLSEDENGNIPFKQDIQQAEIFSQLLTDLIKLSNDYQVNMRGGDNISLNPFENKEKEIPTYSQRIADLSTEVKQLTFDSEQANSILEQLNTAYAEFIQIRAEGGKGTIPEAKKIGTLRNLFSQLDAEINRVKTNASKIFDTTTVSSRNIPYVSELKNSRDEIQAYFDTLKEANGWKDVNVVNAVSDLGNTVESFTLKITDATGAIKEFKLAKGSILGTNDSGESIVTTGYIPLNGGKENPAKQTKSSEEKAIEMRNKQLSKMYEKALNDRKKFNADTKRSFINSDEFLKVNNLLIPDKDGNIPFMSSIDKVKEYKEAYAELIKFATEYMNIYQGKENKNVNNYDKIKQDIASYPTRINEYQEEINNLKVNSTEAQNILDTIKTQYTDVFANLVPGTKEEARALNELNGLFDKLRVEIDSTKANNAKLLNVEDFKNNNLPYIGEIKSSRNEIQQYFDTLKAENGWSDVEVGNAVLDLTNKVESFTVKITDSTGAIKEFNLAKRELITGTNTDGTLITSMGYAPVKAKEKTPTKTEDVATPTTEEELAKQQEIAQKVAKIKTFKQQEFELMKQIDSLKNKELKENETQQQRTSEIVALQEKLNQLQSENNNQIAQFNNGLEGATRQYQALIDQRTGFTGGTLKFEEEGKTDAQKLIDNTNQRFERMVGGKDSAIYGQYKDTALESLRQELNKLNADFIEQSKSEDSATQATNTYMQSIDQLFKKLGTIRKQGVGNVISSNVGNEIEAIKSFEEYAKTQGSIIKPVSSKVSGDLNKMTATVVNSKNEVVKLSATYSSASQSIVANTQNMGQNMSGFGKILEGVKKRWLSLSQYFVAMYLNPYMMYSRLMSQVNSIKELDTALVDLRKTTTMTQSELNSFYYSANDVAKQMGVTTKEIIDQASAWSRLGYSSKEASTQMAILSSQFASISPDMDVNAATDGLVSVMKAFNVSEKDVKEGIMSKINTIGNNFATTNGEVVTGLQRSASALKAANNSLEESIGLFVSGVEITRDAESMGAALKTISMRVRGYDEETEELSEDLKTISGDIADLTKVNGKGGISLFTDKTKQTYKSTYQILKEISLIWDDLTDKQQANVA